MTEATPWRRCSACKKPIALGAVYWACNVSTCNQKRTALCFCSVSCWEVHLPGANHREAWAVEKRAPATAAADDVARGASSTPPPASGGTRGASSTPPASSGPSRGASSTPPASGSARGAASTPPASGDNPPGGPSRRPQTAPREVLIVASRLKDYVRARVGYNTSDRVLEPLSDIVRQVVDRAIENARRDGRMTVLDRDIEG